MDKTKLKIQYKKIMATGDHAGARDLFYCRAGAHTYICAITSDIKDIRMPITERNRVVFEHELFTDLARNKYFTEK